jgi:tripartite-type tricarboxylate transporter receptor subunit TctC
MTASLPAAGQEYPARPLHLLLTNPPGGPTDTSARLFSDRIRMQVNQPVIVENRPGANGRVALDAFQRAEPDGYTLLYGGGELTFLPVTTKGFTLDYSRDIQPVTQLVTGSLAFLVTPAAPYKTIDQLVAWMRANPGKANYANISSPDLFMSEMFKSATRTQFETVRYNGGAPAFQAVIAGQADWLITATGAAKGLHDSGKMRMIVVNGEKRNPYVPDIPAMGESADPQLRELSRFSGFSTFWFGLVASGKAPRSQVAILNAAARKAAQDPDLQKRLADNGFQVVVGSPEEFMNTIVTEAAAWAKVARDTGYVPQ